ncbi:type II secretion system F domain-containing protein [Methanocaldococcus villosus KIN24-T80]|uniref:Type II secretion system F domain-containing protein n=1 Tax=Methanocaldococcus villosus KIN24-T80 TaxID=1069083 RepID=N6UTQ0_9EURY|nr:type II secretion system F family protein [Methanocaldococcus villosus]ENN95714.1 type II secretion system F domain-containing protein [Methanocaldococcus villosus KIN24-T80]
MINLKNIYIKIRLFLHNIGLITLDTATLKELKKIEVSKPKFQEAYTEPVEIEPENIEEYERILFEEELIAKSAESLSQALRNVRIFSRNLIRYLGYENEVEYFKRVVLYMFLSIFGFIILGILSKNIIGGFIKGIVGAVIILVGSIFYPRLKLMLFKGEIKLQILFTLVFMISLLRAGASLPEVLNHISKSREFGIVAYEIRQVLRDVNSGYSMLEALERAKIRTEIPLMIVFFDQIIAGYNKGNLSLLLEKLYEEIVRSSLAKLDSSKFMIQNLGNLTFGIGLIIPFSGMILSGMISNQGFPGILNTLDLLMTKIGPMLALFFGIFVKMKIE